MPASRPWTALSSVAAFAVLLAGCSGGAVDLSQPQVPATHAPTGPTSAPTNGPTSNPTTAPTTGPTTAPTIAPTTSPTTTPTPTPTPTATPVGSAITFNPTEILLAAQKSGCAPLTANFVVSEAGYAGSFTAVSQNTAIATVAPTAGTTNGFTVTSVTTTNGSPGTKIMVTDSNGNSALEPVGISFCLP